MEPIISPWFFYLLGVVEGVRGFFILITCVAGILMCVGFIAGLVARYGSCPSEARWRKKTAPLWRKMKRIAFIPLVFCFVLSILIPTKKTLIWMVVAKNVTYQNVEKAIEAGADFKNELKKDMIEIIETLKGEDKGE